MTRSANSTLVSLDDIRRAAATLRDVAVRTPLLRSYDLEQRVGVPVYLKPEMLQRGGAFKLRGAYTFVSRLSAADRAKGLVAPSSGNHGQAVALAARLYGVKATIVMPTTAPRAKVAGAERLGGRVVFAGTTTAERMAKATEIVEQEGAILVPPYDDASIIAGQGTGGLEIAEDAMALGLGDYAVLVQVGGGGLSAGVSTAIKQLTPNARVIGIEPSSSPKLSHARAAGAPVTIAANPHGLADGLLAVRIGNLTFEHHQAYLDDVVAVGDSELPLAVRFLLDRHKLVAEPSGAITVAALLAGIVKPTTPVVCLLSGGNIEFDGLQALLGGTTT
ncbi:MAG: pyridoxal-5'-phosphate-dependent protein beta subunit [Gemmatimonadetes bacterium]|nr:MAG: pyridoxal-5'-phosphate-dependent protein beta subunit [Gemmatimonadota bacterium]